MTQGARGSSDQREPRQFSGTTIKRGMLFSEATFIKALAVLPADATTSVPAFFGNRAQTAYASHSLKVPVFIVAPISGQ